MTQQSTTSILIGEESLLIQCAQTLLDKGQQVVGILSADPGILSWAQQQEIPTSCSRGNLLDFVEDKEFDHFISVANLRMIPSEIIERAKKMAINFHDGPLPDRAGIYVTTWSIYNDEPEHGVTWHEMTPGADRGGILLQKRFEISSNETSFSLNARCFEVAMETFNELADQIAQGSLSPQPQDFTDRQYFSRKHRPKNTGVVSFEESAETLERQFRALNFGPNYENPVAALKLLSGDFLCVVENLEVLDSTAGQAPGTVVEVNAEEQSLTVTSGSSDLKLKGFSTVEGKGLKVEDLQSQGSISTGTVLNQLSSDVAQKLNDLHSQVGPSEQRWSWKLSSISPLDIPYADRSASSETSTSFQSSTQNLSEKAQKAIRENSGDQAENITLSVALGVYFARLTSQNQFTLGYRSSAIAEAVTSEVKGFFSSWVPLQFNVNASETFSNCLKAQGQRIEDANRDLTFISDIQARYPSLPKDAFRYPVSIDLSDSDAELPSTCELAVKIAGDAKSLTWNYNSEVFDQATIERMQDQITGLIESLSTEATGPISRLPLLSGDELKKILESWNDTACDYQRDARIQELFEAQVQAHPDKVALVYENQSLTYSELNERANQLAHYLRENGITSDTLVGVATDRDLDMVIAVYGVLKSGGAYVPLDPEYPSDRIAFMIEDAKIETILTQTKLGDTVPTGDAKVVNLDTDWQSLIAGQPTTNPDPIGTSKNLAYVIYTSGSTGKPKGVMVEHFNAVNFFVGMDDCIPYEEPGAWLQVTSLSFDISVLEIFWTLTRGFELVIYGGGEKVNTSESTTGGKSSNLSNQNQPLDFSLFYFSSDEGEKAQDKYRLLLEGAKYGDQNGFTAVWTPERHFHAFGGLYPNPSVTSAAIAVITKNVKLRAGSCVLPLHSPIRVAEEWALVDNLSNGRVQISFAAGWQPNDFVFFPDNFANRKEVMFKAMDEVQKLWQGGSVKYTDGTGKEFEVKTLPRPVQKKLPIFVTAAGNPETFRAAGERGENVLTHLLGQSVEEVTEKIKVYREAWKEAGHEGNGHVALMLHTYIGEDEDEVKELVREPMKEYLKSSVMLIQKAAWSFPTFKQQTTTSEGQFSLDSLTDEQLDDVLDFSFERYYETSGLFGTVESTREYVDMIKGCDVDEIACLIDFGVSSDLALDALPLLNEVKNIANTKASESDSSEPSTSSSTIAQLVERHKISHLQCTPSMASMLLLSEEEKKALAKIDHLFVGGEALPPSLAEKLREAMPNGTIRNMYGPTETTIWSSTQDVTPAEPITIGVPIANTQIYILDANLELVPPGIPGELCIGGDGVVRGYLDRPELTAERFVDDKFHSQQGMKLYRTGDLARHREDGILEFISRMDHQVKVRGYRIELGEIESLLSQNADVRECVVIAREDTPGDKRLVAYFLPAGQKGVDTLKLRNHLRQNLPEFMVPSTFVELDKFPLTPNLKVDRKALPAPSEVKPISQDKTEQAPPSNKLEKTIATIWQEVLNLPSMGLDDNFFDLGGHSLLTLQVHNKLKESIETKISLVDMFKFPTIRTLAGFISEEAGGGKSEELKEKTEKRAQSRRDAMSKRRQMRGRRLQSTDG